MRMSINLQLQCLHSESRREVVTLSTPSQVVGSFWYLLTVQRVEACLGVQCKFVAHCKSTTFGCPVPISYHDQTTDPIRLAWAQNKTVQGCLAGNAGDFPFGIYEAGVPLVTDGRFIQKILYPLFWGVMTFRCTANHDLTAAFTHFVSLFSPHDAFIALTWYSTGLQLIWECADSKRPHLRGPVFYHRRHLWPAPLHTPNWQHPGTTCIASAHLRQRRALFVHNHAIFIHD
jgi:hypothetical protein